MKKTTSKVFRLIPSVQQRAEAMAPISLMPALPARVGNEQAPPTIALVDTGAQVSCLRSSFVERLKIPTRSVLREAFVSASGRRIRCDIVRTDLVVCDQDFTAWIRLRDVPFAVMDDQILGSREVDAILGYDSCLANLRLGLDYPQKTLRVSAASNLLVRSHEKGEVPVPTRILEAEGLIKSGSYISGIALIAEGLQEALELYLQRPLPGPQWLAAATPEIHGLPPKIVDYYGKMQALRNKVVHGMTGQSVVAKEARLALRYAKAILRELAYLAKDSYFTNYSCFISYSYQDQTFARLLHDRLQSRGIRCWLDEHQLLPGDDIHDRIEQGIRLWDKVLLCTSKSSLTSWWVDGEINRAFQKESLAMKERGKKLLALIPLNLDDFLFSANYQSAKKAEIKSRVAANFVDWEKDNALFDRELEKVIRALRTDDAGREKPPSAKL